MKEKYQFFYYDPRFRLPLYEIVFHDSVVTTHHWQNASFKFKNMIDTIALTELLYMVPPMYHLNLDVLAQHQNAIRKHYLFFSPLHRKTGFIRMNDFTWLSPDRLLQRTAFDNRLEMIANFSNQARPYQGYTIPARSILALWNDTDKFSLYTP